MLERRHGRNEGEASHTGGGNGRCKSSRNGARPLPAQRLGMSASTPASQIALASLNSQTPRYLPSRPTIAALSAITTMTLRHKLFLDGR